jgi:hypothetical protein
VTPDDNRQLEEALAGLKFDDRPDPAHRDRLESQLLQAFPRRAQEGVSSTTSKWRIIMTIMKSRVTHYSAAAAVLLAAAIAVVLTLVNSIATPAYALAQTMQANRTVRTVHLTNDAGELREAWAEFDEQGNLERYRGDMPRTEDGAKVVFWQKDKASVWFKDKKSYVTVREPNILKMFPKNFFDPKQQIDDLYQAQSDGKVTVKTEEPSKEGEPIRLTATYPESSKKQLVYLIDSRTKLLQQVEYYRPKDDKYELAGKTTYLDYNKPIDPKVFAPDVLADVVRVDQTTQQVGLPKGNLSDEEIAAKVAREFLEAMIAKDYTKAGRLFGGFPADKMRELAGNVDRLRIVSMGKAHKSPSFSITQAYLVSCEVEIQRDGAKAVVPEDIYVRPVYNQPANWAISGDRAWDLPDVSDNARYAAMTAEEAARAFLTACGKEDWDEALKFWPKRQIDDDVRQRLGGLKVVSIGKAFDKEPHYAGKFVPFEIQLKAGQKIKHDLAVRKDNPAGRWLFDGGL